MAMYVDKKLSGVATVQTLSRLNRIYPGKTAPMVVDFRNTPASIQEDFKLYYSDAHVEGDVDPNALYHARRAPRHSRPLHARRDGRRRRRLPR